MRTRTTFNHVFCKSFVDVTSVTPRGKKIAFAEIPRLQAMSACTMYRYVSRTSIGYLFASFIVKSSSTATLSWVARRLALLSVVLKRSTA